MDTLTTTCRAEGCTAAPGADHDALHVTSNEGLLKAFAALTHRMTDASRRGGGAATADLRVQRHLIEAELLRRMGDR